MHEDKDNINPNVYSTTIPCICQLVFFQEKFDEKVKRQQTLYEDKENINPNVYSSPSLQLDEISFLALISKTKHLEKFRTDCVTTLVKC